MMQRLGFQKQLSLGMPLIVFLSLATSGVASYIFTSKIVRELIVRDLESRIESVRTVIEVSYEDAIERQKTLIGVWGPRMSARLHPLAVAPEKWVAENQVTHEKSEVLVPPLALDGRPLSQSAEIVDQISQDSGEATTIFSRIPEGYLRVVTNLKKADGRRAVGTYIPASSPVAKSLDEGKPFVGRAQVLGQWYMTAYVPILKDGHTIGGFFMGTPETASARIAEFLKKQKLFETGYFYIMDDEGTMLLHPALQGKNVVKTTDIDGRLIFQEILEKKNGLIEYHWLNAQTNETQDKMGIFRTFPELGWHVVASLNRAEAEVSVTELRWILTGIAFALTSLMVLVTFLFGRSVSRRLLVVTEQLAETSRSTLESAKALEGSSTSISDSVGRESSSLHETMSALEEVRATTATNQDATGRATELSTAMANRAEEGKNVLAQLSQAIDEIARGNRSASEGLLKSFEEISSIAQVIAGIEQKTRVINDIVFQTKLLSFNASVEAARAGEHGKGFAVVAEEVGRLSSMSGAAADEIRKSLEESGRQVVAIIERAKTQMAETTRSSERSTEQGVKVTAVCQTTFESLLGEIANINEAVHRINVASGEQARGVEEIAKAMQLIETSTHENTKVAEEAKGLSETLTGNADHMSESVSNLRNFVSGSEKQAA